MAAAGLGGVGRGRLSGRGSMAKNGWDDMLSPPMPGAVESRPLRASGRATNNNANAPSCRGIGTRWPGFTRTSTADPWATNTSVGATQNTTLNDKMTGGFGFGNERSGSSAFNGFGNTGGGFSKQPDTQGSNSNGGFGNNSNGGFGNSSGGGFGGFGSSFGNNGDSGFGKGSGFGSGWPSEKSTFGQDTGASGFGKSEEKSWGFGGRRPFGGGDTAESDTKPSRSGFGGFGGFKEIRASVDEANKRKWKELPELRKDFYEEHPEVTAMFPEEAAVLRAQKSDIMVEDLAKNKREPLHPIWKFEHAFSRHEEIMSEIQKNGFTEPSPIQCQMWPMALKGLDCIGIAQTGSGKTLAFLLPALIHIDLQPGPRAGRNGPNVLVLTPTRELAIQIHKEVKKYHYKDIRSVCVYGGACRSSQVNACSSGVEIVIATPGRLNDLVCDQVINLKSITYLVLDEADRMLDMGFEPQIRKILVEIRPDRHTIMTSATWPPTVRDLAKRYATEPFLIHVGSLNLTACKSVTQLILLVEETDKRVRLLSFIENMSKTDKALVFVGRKSSAEHLASDLIRKGIDCQSMHGDRDQSERERALKDLRKGIVRILVATDVASRGLDIVDITHVINYDFPKNVEEYVHRVGRTGRAGRAGTSISFMTRSDWRNAKDLIPILEKNAQDVPNELRQMADRFDAHQERMRDQVRTNPPPWKRNVGGPAQVVDPFTGEPIGFAA